jgi:hypothetical protein
MRDRWRACTPGRRTRLERCKLGFPGHLEMQAQPARHLAWPLQTKMMAALSIGLSEVAAPAFVNQQSTHCIDRVTRAPHDSSRWRDLWLQTILVAIYS